MSASVFLKAEWKNLLLFNYQVDPAVLTPYLPAGTELDTFNGIHYVSLAGFLFKDTKVKGVIVPFHRTFEEVNLRFYVKYLENGEYKHGVSFIKEIIPKKLAPGIANKLFGENYHACEMRHQWLHTHADKLNVEYMWKDRSEWNWISAMAETNSHFSRPGTEEDFICQYLWGYAKEKKNTSEYTVHHPDWRIHNVINYDIHCNFINEYGREFGMLNTTKPTSVFLAEGSEILVHHKRTLELSHIR